MKLKGSGARSRSASSLTMCYENVGSNYSIHDFDVTPFQDFMKSEKLNVDTMWAALP